MYELLYSNNQFFRLTTYSLVAVFWDLDIRSYAACQVLDEP